MKLAWHFSKVNPRFKNREATQGEFFASDTELRGFVREAVQNSLDARRPGHNGPVAVRIFLSGERLALPRETSKRYFRGGWEHFGSETSGLRDVPAPEDPCRFIVYEDTGTTGLTGDTEQYHEVPGQRNPFYYFFRAEGQSNKQESGRGRWGLGKYVFPRSSRIRSFFALTVRCDDGRRLLVGQSILRSHHVDGKSYTPDGWFGGKPPREDAAPPVEAADFIDRFEKDFCLERRDQPGLSIVVPFCDPAWDVASVASCIVQDYFSAVLQDELVVTVEGPESELVIHSQSIADVLTQCEPAVQQHLQSLLELTRWASSHSESEHRIELQCSSARGAPKWSRQEISTDAFERLRETFRREGRAAVRIPVSIQPRDADRRSSWFDVYLERCESAVPRRPVFIREGIVISGVRSRLLREVSAIVQIDHPALASFLGDAENPAHTEWQEESSHFKGKYLNGPATLRFIRNAVPDLCQMLSEETEAEDAELLLDVFSIGTDSQQEGLPVGFETRRSGRRASGIPTSQPSPGRRRSRHFRVTRKQGGFCVSSGPQRAGQPVCTEFGGIEVTVAYDRRHGNPLRKYCEDDFHLDRPPIRIRCTGMTVQCIGPNRLHLLPESPSFELTVTGFDENRDLYVVTRNIPAADGAAADVATHLL